MANISNREGHFWPDKAGIKNGVGVATSTSYVTAYTAGANGGCVDMRLGYDLAGGGLGGNTKILIKVGTAIIGGISLAIPAGTPVAALDAKSLTNIILTANQVVQVNITHGDATGSAYLWVQGIDY